MHSIVCMYVRTYRQYRREIPYVFVGVCLRRRIYFSHRRTRDDMILVSPPGAPSIVRYRGSWGDTSKSRKAAVGCREKSIPPHDEARLDNATRECLANTRMRIRVVRECIPARELTWSAAFRSPWRMPLTWWVNNQSVAMMTSTTTTIASATNRAVALCPCIPR